MMFEKPVPAPDLAGGQFRIMRPAQITAGAGRMRGTSPDKGSELSTQARRRPPASPGSAPNPLTFRQNLFQTTACAHARQSRSPEGPVRRPRIIAPHHPRTRESTSLGSPPENGALANDRQL